MQFLRAVSDVIGYLLVAAGALTRDAFTVSLGAYLLLNERCNELRDAIAKKDAP
jgi:hypothetical protein